MQLVIHKFIFMFDKDAENSPDSSAHLPFPGHLILGLAEQFYGNVYFSLT